MCHTQCGVSIARTDWWDFRSVTDTQVAGGSKLDSHEVGWPVMKKAGQVGNRTGSQSVSQKAGCTISKQDG